MKKIHADQFLYSASDLTSFAGCTHSTWMDYQTLLDGGSIPHGEGESFAELLIQKGLEHESSYLENLKSTFDDVVEIPGDAPFEDQVDLTLSAINSGVNVIYQAVLQDAPWMGHPDFLVRCANPSDLGSYSYEIFDTKLAKEPRPEHIIQICVYSDLLSNAQGVLPTTMHLVAGDSLQHDYAVAEYYFYYLRLKERFESFIKTPPSNSYPEPCHQCVFSHWLDTCKNQWEQDDHLSLVVNMRASQIDKFKAVDIHTVRQLSDMAPDFQVPGLDRNAQSRLQAQASLQARRSETREGSYEVIQSSPGKGFERLPAPSKGDLFFDVEGDPLTQGSLEYLFGVITYGDQGEVFRHWWAHDHVQEKQTFQEFMLFLSQHLAQYPDANIYHYNSYETAALKRLAGRYAACEEQIDNLLRQHKFVDLYQIARHSIRTSESGFSLKDLEVFFGRKRDNTINSADMSVVFYNRWRESGQAELLSDIRDYNKVDCESTYLLREWLVSLRPGDLPWFKNSEAEPSEPKEWEIQHDLCRTALSNVDDEYRDLAEKVSGLLEFHRREAKVEWWETFARQDKFTDELIDDLDCLADLSLTGTPVPEKRSWLYTYAFPPQESRLTKNKRVFNVANLQSAGSIFDIDHERGLIRLKIGKVLHETYPLPTHFSIGPLEPIPTEIMRDAIYEFADSVIAGDNGYQCIRDLLTRSIPRLKDKEPGEAIVSCPNPVADGDLTEDDHLLEETKNAVMNLDNSILSIQGPPGTGKTYIASRVIVEMMRNGKRVGIAANSHKAIHVLLEKIEAEAIRQDFDFVGIKKASGNDPETYYQGIDESRKFIFNLDTPKSVDAIVSNEGSPDDTYGFNVIPLEDGGRLSFADNSLIERPRVWSSNRKQTEEENEDAPEGVEKTSPDEPWLQSAQLFAGTAWLFSRPKFREQLDYLVIDEAGQVSLANVVAMGTATKNIVLVGDHMQLAQPLKGIHPDGAGTSGLVFLLGKNRVIPPEQGIFLDTTRRLHPDICDFVSQAFYEGKLKAHPVTKKRALVLSSGSLPSTGIRMVLSEHRGCIQRSIEEGKIVSSYHTELLKQQFQDVDSDGILQSIEAISEKDILVVTPYNAQDVHLRTILHDDSKIGTVDKFQGQEEQVVLISMVTSTSEDIPRNMEFLYSRNRLNVALSRAKCLSVIILNPNL
ncbi:TM0106 family RecB-like putative nuclease, partial [Dehalococcoidia bacterium]|nr:TM0106 family RecB-like putative nuclease [Dehalococcoidia bacterium]